MSEREMREEKIRGEEEVKRRLSTLNNGMNEARLFAGLGGKRGVGVDVGLDPLGGDGFRALEGEGESAIPDEGREDTEGAGDTEEDSVVLVLSHAVVDEEAARVGINVGPGVLGLTVLSENTGGDLVDLGDELEERILRQVLQGELALSGVTGIGLTKNGVTVARNDLTRVEGIPEGLLDLISSGVLGTDLLLELDDPAEDLLVGETVEGSSETAHGSREGKIGIREGRSDETGGVGRDVTSLVIGVDGEVETHKLIKLVGVVAELTGKVGGVIERSIMRSELAILEGVAVDASSDLGENGEEVEGILESGLPVVTLLNTVLVGLSELRVLLHGSDGRDELRHGVELSSTEVGQETDDVLGNVSTSGQFSRQSVGLLGSGDLASQQQPQETLRSGLLVGLRASSRLGGSLGEQLLKIGDGVATEADTLYYKQIRNKTRIKSQNMRQRNSDAAEQV